MSDLCNRCLVIVDVRTTVRAYWRAKDEPPKVVDCPYPTNMRQLAEWVESMMVQGADDISIDTMPNAFDPVSTWHGDPVCWSHLIECREREWGKRR